MKKTQEHINKERHDFNNDQVLEINSLDKNPFTLFQSWLEDAIEGEDSEPYAMNISTVGSDGNPHSRILYLRDFLEEGYVFYTNYASNKGSEISETGKVAVCFFWPKLQRQIRIEGTIEFAPATMSDKYFASRPRQSQIGAWSSKQSAELISREELMNRVSEFEDKFKDVPVPRPEHWGGYVVKPNYYEFWLGQPSRLHDRAVYRLINDNWEITKLNP